MNGCPNPCRFGERQSGVGVKSMKMNDLLGAVTRRLCSPGERAALRLFWNERTIAAYHRQGLRQIRDRALARPVRLNLGSGGARKEGFLNVDLFPGGDITLDLRKGLPFETGCCELIFSEHFFEHLDYPEAISSLLGECLRVLRPGGQLKFTVPDTEWPLVDYRDGPDAPYFRACREQSWHPSHYTTRLEHINYHFRQDNEHRFAYDFETAAKVLKSVGFVAIEKRPFDPAIDSPHRRVGSLFVSAQKAA
jgi:predicted SAM-dependent methyltransferase